jgi:hypothetical protein
MYNREIKYMSKEYLKELLPLIENNQINKKVVNINSDLLGEEPIQDRLDDDDIILLSEALKKNSSVTKVNLIGQNFSDKGAIALASVKHLKTLNLWGCNIGAHGAIVLAENDLEYLNLSENNLYCKETENYDSFAKMIDAFVKNKTIKLLDISSSYIPPKLIARLIAENTTIEDLSLSSCYLTDEALQDIKANQTLRKLHVSDNNITDEGVISICKNNSLEVLYLNRSEITDKGLYFLSKSNILKELTICSSDNITPKGLQYFFDSKLDKVNPGLSTTQFLSFSQLEEFENVFSQFIELRNSGQYDIEILGEEYTENE